MANVLPTLTLLLYPGLGLALLRTIRDTAEAELKQKEEGLILFTDNMGQFDLKNLMKQIYHCNWQI